MVLIIGILCKNNDFLNLKIDSKIVIDASNKRINIVYFIKILMEDFEDLNIYKYYHIYKETNRNTYYFVKKNISVINLKIKVLNFSKNVTYIRYLDCCWPLSNRLCKFSVL